MAKKKKKNNPKPKQTLKPSEEREVTLKWETALRWEGSVWVHQEDKRSRARAICLGWEETCEKCWNIKGRLGWGSSFRAPVFQPTLGIHHHSETKRETKWEDWFHKLLLRTVSRRYFPCQDLLSQGRHLVGLGGGFPSGGQCVSPKESTVWRTDAQLPHVTVYSALAAKGLAAGCARL